MGASLRTRVSVGGWQQHICNDGAHGDEGKVPPEGTRAKASASGCEVLGKWTPGHRLCCGAGSWHWVPCRGLPVFVKGRRDADHSGPCHPSSGPMQDPGCLDATHRTGAPGAPATPLAPGRPRPLQDVPIRAGKEGTGGGHFIAQEPALRWLDSQHEAHQVPSVGAPAGLQPVAPTRRGREKMVSAEARRCRRRRECKPFRAGGSCGGGSPATGRGQGPPGAHLRLWDSAV